MSRLHVIIQQARQEEIVTDAVFRVTADISAHIGIAEELRYALSSLLGRIHQESGHLIFNLKPDPADVAADHGFAFPHPFGNGQAKPSRVDFCNNASE